MKKALMTALLLSTVLISADVFAGPFEGTELLVGRGVKASGDAKLLSFGLNVQFAPLNVLLSSQRDTLIDLGVGEACANAPDPAACEAAAKEHSDAAMDALGKVSDDDWARVEAAASNSSALQAELVAAGLPAEEVGSVVTYVEQVPADKRADAVAVSRTLAQQEATMVMVEPSVEVNFSLLSVRAQVPLAMMQFENSTDWHLGNITTDIQFGHTWGGDVASAGVSYGLALYLPTGSEDADALALSDLFQAPKYSHSYFTWAPFVTVGMDSAVASFHVGGELVSQHAVRGDPETTSIQYMKYGLGATILHQYSPVSIILELNGLVPINNADAYDALFGVAGLQLKLFWLRAAAAVQLPILQPETEAAHDVAGVDVGELAAYSLIFRLMFTF